MPNKKLLFSSISFFVLFCLFTYLVHLGVFKQFDLRSLIFFQKSIPRSFDVIFSVFSVLGLFEVASVVLLAILFFAKKINKIIVLLGYGSIWVFEMVGKSIIPQNGPPLEYLRTINLLPFRPLNIPGNYFAYPSGHMARSAFISLVILVLILNSKLKKETKIGLLTLLFIFDLLMIISRIYLGEHWTTDVIGGALLGASFGILSTINIKKLAKSF